eukprot:2722688-Rhodomonas_salina.1
MVCSMQRIGACVAGVRGAGRGAARGGAAACVSPGQLSPSPDMGCVFDFGVYQLVRPATGKERRGEIKRATGLVAQLSGALWPQFVAGKRVLVSDFA